MVFRVENHSLHEVQSHIEIGLISVKVRGKVAENVDADKNATLIPMWFLCLSGISLEKMVFFLIALLNWIEARLLSCRRNSSPYICENNHDTSMCLDRTAVRAHHFKANPMHYLGALGLRCCILVQCRKLSHIVNRLVTPIFL